MWIRSILFCMIVPAVCPAAEVKMMSGRPVLKDLAEPCLAGRVGPALPGPWDTLWSFPAPGPFPTGIAWDGAHFWNTDFTSQNLYRLSPTGAVETVFGLPPDVDVPGDLTWDGAHLWMVDEQQARAYQVDTGTGNALRFITLPDSASSDPNSFGIAWDGQYLWNSDYTDSGHIYQLDTVSGAVVAQFVPPRNQILGIAWDGAYLWGVDVASMTGYKMSVPSGSVVDSFAWQVSYPLGLEWDGQYLWNVGGAAARVYKLGAGVGLLDSQPTVAPRTELLSRPEPNPFVHLTRLTCNAGSARVAGVEVFDTRGRLVRHLTPDSRNVLTWNGIDDAGRRAASGVHFIRLKLSDGTVEQRPVLLLR